MGADSVNFRTMKTQLLEDFDESGSAPDGQQPRVSRRAAPTDAGAGVRPHPAVWQRARHENEPAPAPLPATPDTARDTAAPVGQSKVRPEVRPERDPGPDAGRTEPLRVQPHGFAPQPAVLPGGDPDWLAAHLARDAALNERSEWNGRWTRRLAAWGGAGVLLALLAGGGLWLYEQSQVEGALVVVANTNPAPAGAATPPVIGRATPGLPAVAPVSSSVLAPATPVPTQVPEVNNAAGPDAVGGLAGASTGASSLEKTVTEPPVQPAIETDARSVAAVSLAQPDTMKPTPRRQRSHVRKHPKADTSAAIPDHEPSHRQRREETLMQCRAHGYDERQCFQRGCEMTRFGFACKG
jgi:hypothetical protein